MTKIKEYFTVVSQIINNLKVEEDKIKKITNKIIKTNRKNKKIFVIGNGGSAADGDHFAGELICTFDNKKRKPFEVYSLNQNYIAMTAWSNDFSYETYYERCLKAYSNPGDVLLCLTTSGGSKVKKQTKNIVKAIEYAKKNKIFIISLTGRTGGFAKRNSHLNININSKKTSYIQEAHMSILHCICEQLEKEVN